MLLACAGWPCGILDVGSWAAHEGMADVCVFQYQPGHLFRLPPDERELFAEGPITDELIECFARHGRRLSREGCARRAECGSLTPPALRPQVSAWEISDDGFACRYDVVESLDGFDICLAEQLDADGLDGLFASADELQRALQVAGRDFLVKLCEFRPHIVGFRLEAGGFETVRELVAIVRRVCDATVILGGPTATSHPLETLLECDADYVFAGDAEAPLAAFLRAARKPNGRDRMPDIAGLAYHYGGRAYHNTQPADGYERTAAAGIVVSRPALTPSPSPARRPESEVTPNWAGEGSPQCATPRPLVDRAILAANRLDWSLVENFRTPLDSLYFTGGRGCPGHCTFCAKLHGQQVRTKSAEQLLDEIAAADALVQSGRLRVSRWNLFGHVDTPPTAAHEVAWAAVYDEDFFLDRRRAIEFFVLWDQSPLKDRYRLSFQTNPSTLLDAGRPHAELFAWIDRLKPMVQLGAESFCDDVLRRWRKRHTRAQLDVVLDALDLTRQDYTVFQLLTDFDTTAEELIESLRLLVAAALHRPRMRIASSPLTIPLYDCETRRLLDFSGRLDGRVRHFTDYERVQPGWMDPLVAELADLADAELQWTLTPENRDAALLAALEAVAQRVQFQPALHDQARRALAAAKDAWLAAQTRNFGHLSPLA